MGFNEASDNQAQENQSIPVSCRTDPEVNEQDANFRNLIDGDELAIINKLLSVEESVRACAELQVFCWSTELQLPKLQIPCNGMPFSGITPGCPL